MAAPAAKKLSQRDIDSLLGQIGGQEAAPSPAAGSRPAKLYDFRKPDKFSKEHLRALQVIFESYCRSLGTELSALLRTQVTVRLSSVEQTTYEEYLAQLPNPTVAAILSLPPLPDRVILEATLPLMFSLFDRMLGGAGRPAATQREVTEIESSMVNIILQRMLPPLIDAWRSVAVIKPVMDDLVFSPLYIPAAVPGTAAALVVLEASIGSSFGTMSIAIPYTVLEPVMGKLSAQKWLSSPNLIANEPVSDDLRPLQRASVSISVVLGETMVPFGELLYLQPGDVIRLDTAPGEEVPVTVGEHRKFGGLPGRVGNRVAVQIAQVLEEQPA